MGWDSRLGLYDHDFSSLHARFGLFTQAAAPEWGTRELVEKTVALDSVDFAGDPPVGAGHFWWNGIISGKEKCVGVSCRECSAGKERGG